jgi:hypothetical protein
MKSKHFEKKLVLNKRTVVHLNKLKMKAVHGGATRLTCDECDTVWSCEVTFCEKCYTLMCATEVC